MKRTTASQARKDWFRLLDEVIDGEVVIIERGGHRIVVQREAKRVAEGPPPSYARLLKVSNADQADEWTWDWRGPGKKLVLSKRRAR